MSAPMAEGETMYDSIPDYRRFAESAMQRVRKNHQRTSSDRLARLLFNVVLLAGLWGVPLYARWLVMSSMNVTQGLSEIILGRWQIVESGNGFLEFTPKMQVRLVGRNGIVIESADYQIAGEALMVFGFKLQPGNRDLEMEQQQCYRISIRGDQLTIASSDRGFTAIPRHGSDSHLRRVLPHWVGAIFHFQRADDG
jgi:hypothetical protein